MPTAPSSTEPRHPVARRPRGRSRPRGAPSPTSASCSASARRPYDVATCRAASSLVFLGVTLAVAIVPASCRAPHGAGQGVRHPPADAVGDGRHPGLNVASAVASGGGRELISRDQAVAVPGQPHHRPPRRPAAGAAEHRLDDPGLDPARRRWPTRRAGHSCPGPDRDAALAALRTALGQVVAWTMEAIRRGPLRHRGHAAVCSSAWRWPPAPSS